MNLEKNRSGYWDNMKGFLMLLTVFAHVLFQLQDRAHFIENTVDYIYMFHMPAFVFISGFWGKREHAHSFESIIRLIFLYFIFNSIMGFLYGFSSLLIPMYSFWYLPALIVWRLTAHHIAKFREIRLILFAVALFIGFYPSVDNTFAAARIIGFYPYYMAGFLLSGEQEAAFTAKPAPKRIIPGIAALAAAAAAAYFAYSFFRYTDLALQMGAYSEPLDAFGRIVLYIIAFLAIYALRCLTPRKAIPLLSVFGRNSLWIFILHRPFTLLLSDRLKLQQPGIILAAAAAAAVLICLLFGNNLIAGLLNRFMQKGAAIFTEHNPEKKKTDFSQLAALAVSLGFIVTVVANAYSGVSLKDLKKLLHGEYTEETEQEIKSGSDAIYPAMTAQQQKQFSDAFKLSFAGDLILLEDQVKRAYTGEEYDFSPVFAYAKPYISGSDFAVGVFEGPTAGAEAGYSSSNFDDGKELYLNFPDSFAEAVKDAGFDLVTTANNHVLDRGTEGAARTLDVLDQIGLDHTGSYRDAAEKQREHIKAVTCDGIKMVFLSYTYGTNNYDNSILFNGDLSYLTSVISGTEGNQFEQMKAAVEQDFRDAKALSPDLIIVLPHLGTQFANEADEEQEVWFRIFRENGADIILGDHAHAVQPVQITEENGKTVFEAYCPGNFCNLYRNHQGDTSMLVDVYIDRISKQVIGGSIVPLYTQASADGNYRAIPICDIRRDTELRSHFSTDDIARAQTACATVTEVVFGHALDMSAVTEEMYFDASGLLRTPATGLKLTDQMKKGTLYQAMKQASSVCFIGDSVTEGTKNGGCPWYEPILEYFPDKTISNYSKGGCTVSYMTGRVSEIPDAALYVIALGTNDVRYRDESVCAMDANAYTAALGELKNGLASRNPDADFIFIAPWYSTDGDEFCSMSYAQKTALNEKYSDALESFCSKLNLGYINANGTIREALKTVPDRTYLLDHIHPNAAEGVILYSEAVLSSGS